MHFEKSAEIVGRTENLIETSEIFQTFLLAGLSPDFTKIPFQSSFNVESYINTEKVKDPISRSVHGKFNRITVVFNRTQHGIYGDRMKAL